MKERKSKIKPCNVQVRLWTFKDKQTMLRVRKPDQHLVEIWIKQTGFSVIVRTDIFSEADKALAHFNLVKQQLNVE